MSPDVIDVSVVIPVYNPGDDIEDCIRSVLGQTLAADRYEAIFVDDGSTDGTPARLDRLAAEHGNVRVEHIPNSGWPGKPRNVGIDMARGEFVYFVDNDDWIEPDALELLVERARANRSDVVIGKVVGHGKYVPRGLFMQNRDEITLESRTLLGLLTPHKLFRRALLDEQGIRFPEGRRRLEDHMFVMHAYFHARNISVLADRPIYHWVMRDAESNASFQPFEPVGYYRNLREVLDLIDEHTEPGQFRDRLKLQWYRGKLLKRVGGPKWSKGTSALADEHRRALYDEVRKVALERFPPGMADPLPYNMRIRSQILREGSYEAIGALQEMEAPLKARMDLRGKGREEDGVRVFEWSCRMGGPAGPLPLRRRADRVHWVAPDEVAAELPEKQLDVTIDVFKSTVQMILRRTEDRTEFVLPSTAQTKLVPIGRSDPDAVTAEVSGEVRIDPREAAAGSPLPAGEWEILAVVGVLGFTHTTKLRRGRRRVPVIVTSTEGALVPDDRLAPPPAPPPPQPALGSRVAGRGRWLIRKVSRGS